MENKKEFLSYDQAESLKSIGFDELCFGYCSASFKNDIIYEGIKGCKNSALEKTEIALPLKQQAFNWFRTKHNLNHVISVFDNVLFYAFETYIENFKDINSLTQTNMFKVGNYKTYEEAELECLKKLIEITKKKIG